MSETPETDSVVWSKSGYLQPLCEKLERERDELRAEVERLKIACEREFESVVILDAENEQLRADKLRLDFIQVNGFSAYTMPFARWGVGRYTTEAQADTVREAIDAAMKGENEPKPTTND